MQAKGVMGSKGRIFKLVEVIGEVRKSGNDE